MYSFVKKISDGFSVKYIYKILIKVDKEDTITFFTKDIISLSSF